MENKNPRKNKRKNEFSVFGKKVGIFFLRWYYLLTLMGVVLYAFFIWNKYILKSEWSDEKKQSYISEQAGFSFERDDYQKAINLMNSREGKLKSGEKFSGKDIFFPEGF